ncbi:hypothetical protein ACLOJK_037692 [Asimina triloba]
MEMALGDLGVCLLVTGSARCASGSGRWRLRNPMDGSCLDLGAVVFAISWVWRKMLDFEWSKWDADGSGPSANGVRPWTLNDVGGRWLLGGRLLLWCLDG